ncbi:asparaginase [Lentimicrobium sp. S6]|uniref:asparaginase n=1 Tax=Lentimicrobium sp. S6 TaxID=2735872 RepID=UPI001555F729|nr:asparaginase [Lentimicrobium sp. S6]NPD47538.1 asparaginase [Lentimicrobium sp. S6]
MAKKLIEITRGDVVETIHYGDVVVVNSKGDIQYHYGDPNKYTYWRSAAKPIQAFNVILSGAADKYKFTKAEIAIMCASHYGEKFHIKTIESILSKIGLTEEAILGGTVTSLSTNYALELAANQIQLNPMYSDCSGKHVGKLSICQHKGYPTESYKELNHPVQQEILEVIAEMCEVEKEDITIGIDGCSVPVHAMPLKNMALAYARLANPTHLNPPYKEASERIFTAMCAHPEMVSGTNGFCSELIAASNGKLVGKVGAEGVYCVGIKDKDIGFAIKMESGNMAVLAPVVLQVLQDLEVLDSSELQALSKYHPMQNTNDLKQVVGEIRAAFEI